jgi:hypothetical protein
VLPKAESAEQVTRVARVLGPGGVVVEEVAQRARREIISVRGERLPLGPARE